MAAHTKMLPVHLKDCCASGVVQREQDNIPVNGGSENKTILSVEILWNGLKFDAI
jgi:hypothetical protein